MGICHSDTDEKNDLRSHSIFVDMKNEENMKKRFQYESNFKIGPYFQEEQENQSRIIKWEKMARKSTKRKASSIQQKDQDNNKFIVNKLDKMLFNIQMANQEQFYKNIIVGGPPAALRWSAWKTMLQENVKYEPGLYERLIEKLDINPQYSQIQKDIIRTFPDQYYFSHEGMKGKSMGHQQLHRVLGAISTYYPNCYCQSMNFILGLLIMVSGGSEIDVFWSFVSLVRNKKFLIIGLYEDGMPQLKFLEFITLNLMKKHLPKIQNKFEEIMVPTGFWLLKWLMTLFIYAFPATVCIRLWDYILAEGIFGLVSIIIPILKNYQEYLTSMQDLEDMEYFQQMTRQSDNKDSKFFLNMQKIIDDAKNYEIKPSQVVKYAKDFIKQNEHLKNEYVNMYLDYEDDEKFTQLVNNFIEPKVYTHPSRSMMAEQDFIIDNNDNNNDGTEIKNNKNLKNNDEESGIEYQLEGGEDDTQYQTQIQNQNQTIDENGTENQASNYLGQESTKMSLDNNEKQNQNDDNNQENQQQDQKEIQEEKQEENQEQEDQEEIQENQEN